MVKTTSFRAAIDETAQQQNAINQPVSLVKSIRAANGPGQLVTNVT